MGDWIEHLDEASGRKFYFNQITSETSWEAPFDVLASAYIDSSAYGDLEQWTEHISEDGVTYYYNSKTQETSWTKISSNVSQNLPNIDNIEPLVNTDDYWTEKTDPDTGNIYYYNSKTEAVQWSNPFLDNKEISIETSSPNSEEILIEEKLSNITAENNKSSYPSNRINKDNENSFTNSLSTSSEFNQAELKSVVFDHEELNHNLKSSDSPKQIFSKLTTKLMSSSGKFTEQKYSHSNNSSEIKKISFLQNDTYQREQSNSKAISTKLVYKNDNETLSRDKNSNTDYISLQKESTISPTTSLSKKKYQNVIMNSQKNNLKDSVSLDPLPNNNDQQDKTIVAVPSALSTPHIPAHISPLPAVDELSSLLSDITAAINKAEAAINRGGESSNSITKFIDSRMQQEDLQEQRQDALHHSDPFLWKPERSPALICKLGAQPAAVALRFHRHMAAFIGERRSNKKPMDHFLSLFRLLWSIGSPSQELCDEAFCQLLRYCNRDVRHFPSPQQAEKAWLLLSLLLACAPPGPHLLPLLLTRLRTALSDKDGPVNGAVQAQLRRAALSSLRSQLPPRRLPPDEAEVEALAGGIALSATVHFADQRLTTVAIDSWTTVQELCVKVQRLLLPHAEPGCAEFDLFSICYCKYTTSTRSNLLIPPTDALLLEHRFPDDEERVVDLLHPQLGKVEDCRLLYCVKYFTDLHLSQLQSAATLMGPQQLLLDMFYTQAVRDVHRGHYPLSTQDIVSLSAIRLHGLRSGGRVDYMFLKSTSATTLQRILTDAPADLLPPELLKAAQAGEGKILSRLHSCCMELTATQQLSTTAATTDDAAPPLECMEPRNLSFPYPQSKQEQETRGRYLLMVQGSRCYGAAYFAASSPEQQLATGSYLAVSHRCILTVDGTTRRYRSCFQYDEVVRIGFSEDSFLLVVSRSQQHTSSAKVSRPGTDHAAYSDEEHIVFQTQSGKAISEFVLFYLKRISSR